MQTAVKEKKQLYIVFENDKFIGAGLYTEKEVKKKSPKYTFIKM